MVANVQDAVLPKMSNTMGMAVIKEGIKMIIIILFIALIAILLLVKLVDAFWFQMRKRRWNKDKTIGSVCPQCYSINSVTKHIETNSYPNWAYISTENMTLDADNPYTEVITTTFSCYKCHKTAEYDFTIVKK